MPEPSPEQSPLLADLPLAPQTEGSLELLEKIGEGGMGQVYRVRDRRFQREAALKLLRVAKRSENARARFCREARVTAFLDHPSIPPVYEYGQTARGELFILMKLVRGQSLRALIEERRGSGSEGLDALLEILIKVCEAVAYAHSQGVIHRDIKPDNILIGRFGDVYLMDWGLARYRPESQDLDASYCSTVAGSDPAIAGPNLTHEGATVGTWGYMSPEQMSGEEVGPASDVFALGAVLYEVLWGHPPIDPSGIAGIAAVTRGRIRVPRSGAPRSLIRLCRACLAIPIKERPASATGVAEAIRAARPRRGSVSPKRHAATGLAALLTIGALAFAWSERQARRELEEVLAQVETATSQSRPPRSETPKTPEQAARTEEPKAAALAALLEGDERLKRGDPEGALACYGEAIASDRLYALAYVKRARLRQRRSETRAALDDWSRAIECSPGNARFYFARGQLHERRGEAAEALADYTRSIERAPRFALAHNARGALHFAKGRLRAALLDFDKAVELDGSRSSHFSNRGYCLHKLDRREQALKDLNRALELDPGSTSALVNRGNVLTSLQRYEAALRDYDRAIALDKAVAYAYSGKAIVYYEQGRLEAALRDFRSAIALDPSMQPGYREVMAQIAERLKKQ